VQRETGAQHGARKQELEALGHHIENRMRRQLNGEMWSWYRLVRDANESSSATNPVTQIPRPSATVGLFSVTELQRIERWIDPEELR
jgi:hypothetical protein